MSKLYDAFHSLYSGDNAVKLKELRYLPRWVVIVIDALICTISVGISFYIVSKFGAVVPSFVPVYAQYMLIVSVNLLGMFVFKTYAGIIRHSTFFDLFKILLSSFFTFVVLFFFRLIFLWVTGLKILLTPMLMIYFLVSVTFFFLFRMIIKQFFHYVLELKSLTSKKRVVVVGIDDASVAIARVILDNSYLPYQLVGFVTKRSDSKKAVLLGKKIYSQENFFSQKEILNYVEAILIIKEIMSKEELEEWVNLSLDKGLQVLKSPSVSKMRGKDLQGDIRNFQIEDLLNRRPIKIENDEVKRRHYDKNVLITGGAGSIGSEIVRQVSQFNPSLIVVLDQAESPLYEIELELRDKFPNQKYKFVLGDISNYDRLAGLFDDYHFSMVYHAAAYKHVPLVEENPHEAILVNMIGTKNLALLSKEHQVNRFVMVSTDKAVNPTNVMGASKRSSELYVQSLQNTEGNITKFITTRFGNVLGSNGSVIPHFKKQIEKGGPVTITHPDIIRYFMTIPEACELVLQAGTMGNGGEIYVFDMGDPVKILDLAKRMIKLSGFTPDLDIKIVCTGLRPGEKLYEELLSDNTKTLPTHNKKIMISKDDQMDYETIENLFLQISESASKRDKHEVVRRLKMIVPEFVSQNSEFEILDIK